MDFVVRPGTIRDAPGIAAVHVQTWRTSYKGIVPDSFLDGLSIARRADQWREALSQVGPPSFVWVAEATNSIVGFSWVGPARDEDAEVQTAELYAVYVLSTSQRSGIGSTLVRRSVESLIQERFRQATLWVLARNVAAQKFYERLGWEPEGATKTEVWQGTKFDEIRYRIDLAHIE